MVLSESPANDSSKAWGQGFMPLPLKLSPFEYSLLADDRPSHPMTFFTRMKFSGRLDPETFETALRLALVRHPLLCAHVTGDRLREAVWTSVPDAYPPVYYVESESRMRFQEHERIDLRKEIGLRFWIRQERDGCEVRAQFHHACCDAVGEFQFLADLFCAYDLVARGSASPATMPVRDPELLKRPNRFQLGAWKTLARSPLDSLGVAVGLAQVFLRQPVVLASPEIPSDGGDQGLWLQDCPSHTFDRDRLARLLVVSRAAGVSVNLLLLRDILLALHAWNSEHDPTLRKRRIRIMVPVSLRGTGDDAMPAANAVGLIPVDRYPHRHSDPARLLATIKLGMSLVRRLELGLIWVQGLRVMALIPGAIEYLARRDRCGATSVLTNMGRVFENVTLERKDGKLLIGDLTLESLSGAAPVRPHTGACLCVIGYAGRLMLGLSYDRVRFTVGAAQALMNTIVDRIERTADEGVCGVTKT